MVHSAYDSFELLRDCDSKIESIESYRSKILLGCSDGSLRIYTPPAAVVVELRKEPYTLERTLNGFARRPLVSMQVVELRELSSLYLNPSLFTAFPVSKPSPSSPRPRAPTSSVGTTIKGSYASPSKSESVFSNTMVITLFNIGFF